jgi:NADH-quinone oxidoreductase subunit D
MLLNVGPSHPAMHGVIKMVCELEGETVLNCEIEIGYLHRAFEKSAENVTYTQVIPYTDRLNYVSPLINNFGFCLAVEKIMGIEAPERAQYVRVIMSELSRITDHLTCIGASAMEVGAMTVFLYMVKAREYLYELIEEVCGARLTVSYGRIGGVVADLPEHFEKKTRKAIKKIRTVLKEVDGLLTQNRIFIDRMKGIGVISQEDAISYGVTGPFLRSTGIDYDVRKKFPYLVYDRIPFDVPTGTTGDNFDRYLVRMEEIEQSIRIVEGGLEKLPGGEIMTEIAEEMLGPTQMAELGKRGETLDLLNQHLVAPTTGNMLTERFKEKIASQKKEVTLPGKEKTYGSIEGLMNHFKLIMNGHGIRPPKGEAYFPVEGANGELGFYVISDGSDIPYRVRVRPPCFPIMEALEKILKGDMIADIVPTFGSVNMIAGELDR